MPSPRDTPATGAWKYLSAIPEVQGAVGQFAVTDPRAGQAWVFSGNMAAEIKGSQASAFVLTDAGGWGTPPMLGTQRFMRLRLEIWTDPVRDGGNNIVVTQSKTIARCLDAFRVAHKYLQRTDPDTQVWGDLVTFSCQLLVEPEPVQMPDGDQGGMGAVLGTAVYGVSVSGWLD